MEPEVARAVPRLVKGGVLSPEEAALPLRIARGELLSVRQELRAALYVGVVVVAAGVGLLVKENLDQIGPTAIAVALGLAAAACFAWVVRIAPPFSWEQRESPHLAFDYVLLLGALLAAADLAHVEVAFTALGKAWPWHLLVVAALYAALAVRFDSRVLFSLALTTFAAWRGVAATSFAAFAWPQASAGEVRLNAIACGTGFILVGALALRSRRKPHFENVATHVGWLLLLGALVQGALESRYREPLWAFHGAMLLAVSAVLATLAFRARRFSLLVFGVVGGYVALARLVLRDGTSGEAAMLWLCLSAVVVVVTLVQAHRRIRGTP